MKQIGKLPILLALIFAFTAFCACAKNLEKNESIIYHSDDVTVRLLDDEPEDNVKHNFELLPFSTDRAYGKNPSIFNGKIKNIRVVSVEYEFMDAKCTDELTLVDIDVTKVISDKTQTLSVNSSVTVGLPYNCRAHISGGRAMLPLLREGAEFLIFSTPSSYLENDSLELYRYSDYWVHDPWRLMVEKIGDCYFANDSLTEGIERCGINELVEKAGSGDNVRAIQQDSAIKLCNEKNINIDGVTFENIQNLISERMTDADGCISEDIAQSIFIVDAELFESSIATYAAQY